MNFFIVFIKNYTKFSIHFHFFFFPKIPKNGGLVVANKLNGKRGGGSVVKRLYGKGTNGGGVVTNKLIGNPTVVGI